MNTRHDTYVVYTHQSLSISKKQNQYYTHRSRDRVRAGVTSLAADEDEDDDDGDDDDDDDDRVDDRDGSREGNGAWCARGTWARCVCFLLASARTSAEGSSVVG